MSRLAILGACDVIKAPGYILRRHRGALNKAHVQASQQGLIWYEIGGVRLKGLAVN